MLCCHVKSSEKGILTVPAKCYQHQVIFPGKKDGKDWGHFLGRTSAEVLLKMNGPKETKKPQLLWSIPWEKCHSALGFKLHTQLCTAACSPVPLAASSDKMLQFILFIYLFINVFAWDAVAPRIPVTPGTSEIHCKRKSLYQKVDSLIIQTSKLFLNLSYTMTVNLKNLPEFFKVTSGFAPTAH